MTCREFQHAAASLTLWELSRPGDRILDHAEECSQCAGWLDQQRILAVGMQALQVRTAGREAGPHVERALLEVFRQEAFETTQPVAAFRSAPIAFRLSRFFEVGAYAAAAAAIAVGLFLGVRLLEQRSVTGPVRSQAAPVVKAPMHQTQSAANTTRKEVAPTAHGQPAMAGKHEVAARPASESGGFRTRLAPAVSQPSDDPEYVALMFCDPLICSNDAQVVRMELPGAGTSDRDAQTQVADVVVGDDGLVRAMRIVN
jgi:hypothetical protein